MEICLEMAVSHVKIISTFNGHSGQLVSVVPCYAICLVFNPAGNLEIGVGIFISQTKMQPCIEK
jgi:hypothetical protein